MEILSFVLGMSVVVVIAVSVVAVIGFVKARKIEKELERIGEDVYRQIERNQIDYNRRADELENHIFSQLDSRLDKLESKLMDTIKNGCEPVKQKLTNNK
jgi:signal transduction histidine kinase